MRRLAFVVGIGALGAVMILGTSAAQPPSRTRVFMGALLIDGTDRQPIDNATIVVRDGRVVEVGTAKAVRVPAGAERMALGGKVVMPGLINAHGHVNHPRDLTVYAAYGVTTVFSLGDEPADVFAARDSQSTASLTRSRVFVAGPVLIPQSPSAARSLVAKHASLKVDTIKIRVDDNLGTVPKMAPDVYRAVIDEGHKQGLRTAVHLFYAADAQAVLEAGADFIAHSVRDTDIDDELIARLKARNVCVAPTLMREVSTFIYETAPPFLADPFFLAHADASWVAELLDPAVQASFRTSMNAQRYRAGLEVAKRNLKALSVAGVPIAMGTDTGPKGRFQGYFELMELELMVQAGLTPRQALLAATRDAARCHKLDDLGTLEAGKWADFVVLNADPWTNISNVRVIDSVYIAGNRITR